MQEYYDWRKVTWENKIMSSNSGKRSSPLVARMFYFMYERNSQNIIWTWKRIKKQNSGSSIVARIYWEYEMLNNPLQYKK